MLLKTLKSHGKDHKYDDDGGGEDGGGDYGDGGDDGGGGGADGADGDDGGVRYPFWSIEDSGVVSVLEGGADSSSCYCKTNPGV